MTTKEKIAVMQAYEDGKKIQYKTKASLNKWKDIDEPKWNWDFGDYRIKPEEDNEQKFMTNKQLAEWLAKGNGQRKLIDENTVSIGQIYLEEHENLPVVEDMVIRPWDSDEWVKPTVDIYMRDCKLYCRTPLS